MSEPEDEATRLRADLYTGQWCRLLDPLLPLLLWENPGGIWWWVAHPRCARRLLAGCGYKTETLPVETCLEWLGDLRDTHSLMPAEVEALSVLDRWPPP